MTSPRSPSSPEHPWPATRVVDVVDQLHDVAVRDPYRWLEDEHAPEVQSWMQAQDAYTRGELAKLPERDALAKRLAELFYFDAVGAPLHRGGRYFYTRKHADKEKTVVYWKQGEQGTERVLFDPNTWSADGSKALQGFWPSYDGTLVAYTVSEHNSDESVMHVFDVAAGKPLADVIPGAKYSSYAGASWAPDGRGFYYTWVPPVGDVPVADRPGFAEVRFHALGTDPQHDPVVYGATHDTGTFIQAYVSRDGHWLVAAIQRGWSATDIFFKDARRGGAWQPLVAGVAANFQVDVWRDHFYVFTNDGAPRYRVFKVDPTQPARAHWREIVSEQTATLSASTIVGEHLVLTYRDHAADLIERRDLDGKLVGPIALPGHATIGAITGNPDEDTAYLSYTSFTEPQVIYRSSVRTGKVDEWARVALPFDGSRIVTEQVSFRSKDGTAISMFLLHDKDVRRDGTNPTILTGYGGFNRSLTPEFAGLRVVWLERGGVYAIPNLRGGGEYGEDWHAAGMLLAKQNVFDDFIAAGEYLIAQKWTSADHLAITGTSNGGLLVGAAMTQRPDLFRAVVCSVPLLDMLRYHLFGSGKTWVPEYGSADDPAQFAALWAYSPYRRAIDDGPRAYPAVLFDSADHDDRVDPLHARKLAAALQARQTAERPVLLRIERNAGHFGSDMVKQQVARLADQLAFLRRQLQ